MAQLGNLVRLQPLQLDELPPHPLLLPSTKDNGSSETSARPGLSDFVTATLTEAWNFTEHTIPNKFQSKGLKKASPSTSKVELLAHSFPQAEIEGIPWRQSTVSRHASGQGEKEGENWFARRSRHANHGDKGSATWSEFDFGLRIAHSEHEMEYTPDVYDCYEALNWDEALQSMAEVEGNIEMEGEGSFSDIRMGIREMCHKLPPPLNNRVFAVVVVTAKGPRQHSLLVVQIPVDIKDLSAAMYSNNRNIKEGKSQTARAKTVLGHYTSIERCQILPDQNIEWLMATASDAKGWLPMRMQKLGVPGAIVKDVGLFMDWNAQRKKGRET